ncbi:Asp23/Gls24 family envelope stress response protein [Kineococcus gynurae]|uniref:Asp23/Gls24 family envelope stress response protein n=1 Tax=Kineococcus gynurae TaxID=452979 RepID=A0ABV5LRI1_9ACTN
MAELTATAPLVHLEPADRGGLQVSDRAVAKIATAAALQVDGVAPRDATRPPTESLAGAVSATKAVLTRPYPRVSVTVAGHRARASVEIETLWPRPAAQVAAAVRDRVAAALHDLADLQVDGVDVTVAAVVRGTPRAERRIR